MKKEFSDDESNAANGSGTTLTLFSLLMHTVLQVMLLSCVDGVCRLAHGTAVLILAEGVQEVQLGCVCVIPARRMSFLLCGFVKKNP